jgi:hypothetical protein
MSNPSKAPRASIPYPDQYRDNATASGKANVTLPDTSGVDPRGSDQTYANYYRSDKRIQGSSSTSFTQQVLHADSTAESVAAQYGGSDNEEDQGERETVAESVVAQDGSHAGSDDGKDEGEKGGSKERISIKAYPEGQGPPGSIPVKVTPVTKPGPGKK